MDYTRIYNGNVITENECIKGGCVIFSNDSGRIIDVLDSSSDNYALASGKYNNYKSIDAHGNYISPGFIDLHVHGGGGADYMDGTEKAIIDATMVHLSHGTTSIYPTTVACSKHELFAFFDKYKTAVNSEPVLQSVLMGIHLEGPYLNKKFKGAQREEYCYTPVTLSHKEVLAAADGVISRWSSAPELEKVIEIAPDLIKNNILPAIAHSDADYAVVSNAHEAGYSHITHFYNAMSTIKKIEAKRFLGVIESAYLIDNMTVEVIADGMHLPYELLKLVYKLKGPDKVALITDAMRAAGMPDGKSILGSLSNGIEVDIHDGCAWMPGNTGFAGSTATTDRMVRNMYHNVGVGIVDSVKMASLTPAKIMKTDNDVGSVSVGKRANLLIFDENVKIEKVFVDGTLIK